MSLRRHVNTGFVFTSCRHATWDTEFPDSASTPLCGASCPPIAAAVPDVATRRHNITADMAGTAHDEHRIRQLHALPSPRQFPARP